MGNRRLIIFAGALLVLSLGATVAQAQDPIPDPPKTSQPSGDFLTPVLAITPPIRSTPQASGTPSTTASATDKPASTPKKSSGNPIDDFTGELTNKAFNLKKTAYVQFDPASWRWFLAIQIFVGFLASVTALTSLVSVVRTGEGFRWGSVILLLWSTVLGPFLGILLRNAEKFWPEDLDYNRLRLAMGWTTADIGWVGIFLYVVLQFHAWGEWFLIGLYYLNFALAAAENLMGEFGKRLTSAVSFGAMVTGGLSAGWLLFPQIWYSMIQGVEKNRPTGIFTLAENVVKTANMNFAGVTILTILLLTILVPLILLAAIAWSAPYIGRGVRYVYGLAREHARDQLAEQRAAIDQARLDLQQDQLGLQREELDQRRREKGTAGKLVVDGEGTERSVQKPRPVPAKFASGGNERGNGKASSVAVPPSVAKRPPQPTGPATRLANVRSDPKKAVAASGTDSTSIAKPKPVVAVPVRPNGSAVATSANTPVATSPHAVSQPTKKRVVADAAVAAGTAAVAVPGEGVVKATAATLAAGKSLLNSVRASQGSAPTRDPEIELRTGGD